MNGIELDYDEKDLIRREEMALLWGPNHIPPQSLIDYWHRALKDWLDEYTGKVVHSDSWASLAKNQFTEEIFDVKEGEILRLAITGEGEPDVFVIALSRKEKDGEAVWLCCPISRFASLGTMWEFFGSTPTERQFVVQTWHVVPIKEKELLKIGRKAGSNNFFGYEDCIATPDTVKMIMHSYERMMNCEYQDLPMTSVGPRVFRTNDPRRRYQDEENARLKPVVHMGQIDKEKLKKAFEERFGSPEKQEPQEKEHGK